MEIREYELFDSAAVRSVWQRAFTGPPWYEQLGQEEMVKRWQACCGKRGFGCLVMESDGQVVGFISWNTPTLEDLAKERGSELATFAAKFELPILWGEIICVDPDYQGQGAARRLREGVISRFQMLMDCLLLTRHREDNIPIINLSRSMGFLPVGIKSPSSQMPGLNHEYWYRRLYLGAGCRVWHATCINGL